MAMKKESGNKMSMPMAVKAKPMQNPSKSRKSSNPGQSMRLDNTKPKSTPKSMIIDNKKPKSMPVPMAKKKSK